MLPLHLHKIIFIEVRGKVVDGNMGQAMEFVTVFIADPSTQQLLTGTTN